MDNRERQKNDSMTIIIWCFMGIGAFSVFYLLIKFILTLKLF
jgi:hypothetical protein